MTYRARSNTMTKPNEMDQLIEAFDELLLEYRSRSKSWPEEQPEPVEIQRSKRAGMSRAATGRRAAPGATRKSRP
jgi:hypothetical protein